MSAYANGYGFSFTWRIDKFSFCNLESIASPYFTDEKLCPTPWQLVLYPGCEKSFSDGRIKCELCKYECEVVFKIDLKIEIIGPSGDLLGDYEGKNVIFDANSMLSDLVETACVERDILEANKDTLTVRCHMSRTESRVENTLNCIARTRIIVNHQSLRLRWRRDKELRRLFYSDNENEYITEGFIYFPDLTKYLIDFHKINDDIEIRMFMSDSDEPQCVECKISLLDVSGCSVLSVRDRHLFTKDYNSWILPRLLPTISGLKLNQNKFVKSGSMIVLWELFCSGGVETQEVSYVNSESKLLADYSNDTVMTDHTLQSDIRNLFSDRIFCDVKFRVNDEIVEAHKSILASRSPVFHAMFQQDMLETQTGVVDIQDVDVATLKALLNFMYSDAVDNMEYDCAKNLLIVSDRYQVHRLKEMCASFLMSDISEGNACEIAALADMVSHADLKSFAVDFIVDHSKDIFIMPIWLPWIKNNMEIATVIFQKLTDKHI